MFLDRNNKIKKYDKAILNVDKGFLFWKEALFEKCVRIFEWTGLPFPQKEIEIRLLLNGFCGFVDDEKKGIMVASGSLSGVTQYYDIFKNFTYSAPTANGGTKVIGKKCVLIENTSLRNPLFPMIERYALLLAHADATLRSSLVNMRYCTALKGNEDSTVESLQTFLSKTENGETSVITDSDILETNILLPLQNTQNGQIGKSAVEIRNEILRMFLCEIGIRFSKEKRGNMTEDEINTNDQLLLFNINDMLRCRKNACNELKKVFNLDVDVKLSEEFKMLESEEIDSDN